MALLLTLVMLFGMVPVSVMASDSDSDYMKIVHLDCGRKYFTVDWVKALLHEAAEDGYTHLQLAFGNDGLRFLLDDMSVTVSGTTYSSDAVKSAIQSGNAAYTTASTGEWTQSEMDEIIAEADSVGMEIIPLLNTPGHMDAILSAATQLTGVNCSYNGSATTIDIENTTATGFTLALVQKYITYFANEGCRYFNLGADEYANDRYSTGSMGFGNLVSNGKYGKYIDYVNQAAGLVEGAGLRPIIFNDGVYFNGNTSYGTFDSEIVVEYWTSGWSGYQSMNPSGLIAKGHSLINVNGDFYYVLGKNDQFDSNGYTYAGNFSNTGFMSSSNTTGIGSCFCIWCDYPGAETEQTIASNTRLILRAMGLRMNDQSIGGMSTDVIPRGFNADGTIAAPAVPTVTLTNENVSVTAPGLTDLQVTVCAPQYSGSYAAAIGYSITPEDENGVYSSGGTVVLPRSAEWTDADRIFVFDVSRDATLPCTVSSDTITFFTTHFSQFDAVYANEAAPENTEYVSVPVERTTAVYHQDGEQSVRTAGDSTIATANVETRTVSASYTYEKYTATDTIADGVYLVLSRANTAMTNVNGETPTNYAVGLASSAVSVSGGSVSGVSDSMEWTFTRQSDGTYYIQDCEGNYLNVIGSRNVQVTNDPHKFNIIYHQGSVVLEDAATTHQVNYYAQEKQIFSQWDGGTSDPNNVLTLYKKTGNDDAVVTDITFTGVSAGTTSYIIGNTEYVVTVSEPQADPVTIEFWITNARCTDPGTSLNYLTVNTTDDGIHSASGVLVRTLVPNETQSNARSMGFWRCMLPNSEQTEENGVDQTNNGRIFTRIRFWTDGWSVYEESTNTWIPVASTNQLIAYYLEQININNQIGILTADWGTRGDGTQSWGYYPESNRCAVAFQVVYEDGSLAPATTSAADLASDSILYGFWQGGRGIGTVNFNVSDDKDVSIYRVTATTGTMQSTVRSNQYVQVTSYTWNNNETDFYNGSLTRSVTISNDARNPADNNLKWSQANGAILIRVYVKAEEADGALQIHYVDDTVGLEFFRYFINVSGTTVFDSRFAKSGSGLVYNTVLNSAGYVQTVQSNITSMPGVPEIYRNCSSTFTRAERAEGGKDVYLYYRFDNTHAFVLDFGLDWACLMEDLIANPSQYSYTLQNYPDFGTLQLSDDASQVIYSLNDHQALDYMESIYIHVTHKTTGDVQDHMLYLIPATTVYYEEGFATVSGFTVGSCGDSYQTATSVGHDVGSSNYGYGYDSAYASGIGPSNGTEAVSTTSGDTMTFTFTGTGLDICANTTPSSGLLLITMTDGTRNLMRIVDTHMGSGKTSATSGQAVTTYNVPVATYRDLAFEEHTVTITHIDDNRVAIDGFRVYGTLEDQGNKAYRTDKEDNPVFVELREYVLKLIDTVSAAAATIKQEIREALRDQTSTLIMSNDSGFTEEQMTDLLESGPKNEIYLASGQSFLFKIDTKRTVQIGLKAVDAALTYSITTDGGAAGVALANNEALNTSTEMFYKIAADNAGRSQAITYTITNHGAGILAITSLKVSDEPGSVIVPLSAKDLRKALIDQGSGKTKNNGAIAFPTVSVENDRTLIGTVVASTEQSTEIAPAPVRTGFAFRDVTANDWFFGYVRSAWEKGLIDGMTADEFAPNGELSVAQAIKLAAVVHQMEKDGKVTLANGSPWYSTYVDYAVKNGIIGMQYLDYTAEQLNAPAKRAEFAHIFFGALSDRDEINAIADNVLPDVKTGDAWAADIYTLYRMGILQGNDAIGTFAPNTSIKRSEVAAILVRMYEHAERVSVSLGQ